MARRSVPFDIIVRYSHSVIEDGALFGAVESLGYRLGVRLRHERRWFRALPGIWFIGGHGYRLTDIREDNVYDTVVIDHRGKPLSRRALKRRGIES